MPLEPIKMTPAYRYGAMTPWGGDSLGRLYGRPLPSPHTGESLEVSAIPGLESRDENGETLTRLLEKHGPAIMGTKVRGPFPLLLKLLDARDTLSVQVHPDDAYAARVEHKLGKTEAWHILSAEEGACLVYGVTPGVEREELRRASLSGAEVEKKLRFVSVRAGETYYIPAGMVHAIGKGIVLYEIQQSSDVTYRFYDWERTDQNGKKRELHIGKAVDVTDVRLQLEAARETPLEKGHTLLLRQPYFTLERFQDYHGTLTRNEERFAILTATGETGLSWLGGEIRMTPGTTVLLPADGFDLTLETDGALLSYPTV